MLCDSDKNGVKLVFDNGVELTPHRVDISQKHDEFDYLEAFFDRGTAKKIDEYKNAYLFEPIGVNVILNGQRIRRMYFDPENLTLGTPNPNTEYPDEGRIELLDLRSHLRFGSVDYAPRETSIREIYRTIFKAREDEGFFTGVTINVPDKNELLEGGDLGLEGEARLQLNDVLSDDPIDFSVNHVLNFEEISPLEALSEANNKTGLGCYVDSVGTLVVGPYSGDATYTASQQRKEHDLHVEYAGISQPTKRVRRVNVEGPILLQKEQADIPTDKEMHDRLDPYTGTDTGYRMRAVVTDRAAPEDGLVPDTFKAHKAQPNELPAIAMQKLREIQVRNHNGQITVNMGASNSNDPIRIGDEIELQEPQACGAFIPPSYRGDTHRVAGVQHRMDTVWKTVLSTFKSPTDPSNLRVKTWLVDTSKDGDGQKYSFEEVFGYPASEAPEFE